MSNLSTAFAIADATKDGMYSEEVKHSAYELIKALSEFDELDEVVVHPFEIGMRKYFSKSENVAKEKITDPNKPKGKRGRPKSDTPYVKPVYVPTGGKRGRRPLDPAIKAEREAQLAAKQALPRGKRGRPKKQVE